MAHSLVGLSDSKFDFELVKKEIDHDFFDNPGTSSSLNDVETKSSNVAMKKEEDLCKESLSSSSAHEENQKLNLGDLCQNLPNNDHSGEEDTGENFNSLSISEHENSSKRQSPAPSSLVFSRDTIDTSNDEETPVNCPFNNFSTGISQQNIFCTGELLECLPNTDYYPSNFLRGNDVEQQQHGSFAYYQLMSQCASSHEQQRSSKFNSTQQHHRLFDLSDSSSDDLDSQSESSEIASLDTDDEEFVNMLEKYYDSIDLGDSDYSDITEVSPLSSQAASPLPPFNGGGGRTSEEAAGVLESNEILLENNQEEVQSTQPSLSIRNSMFQKRCPLEAKPLPPLIIHTMEEIPAPTPEEPNTPLAIAISSLDSAAINRIKSSSSLLMTIGQTENKKQDQSNCFDPIKPESEDFLSSGSEEQLRQSMSFSSSSRMSSGILSSSSSGHNEWSVGTSSKSKAAKNFTFTPDQMRRIDRENSILLRKILDTNKAHNHGHGNHNWLHVKGTIHHHRSSHHHHHHHQSHKSSSAILRQRQQKRIDHENSILVRRLKSVKPSKEIVDAGFRPTNGGDNLKFNM